MGSNENLKNFKCQIIVSELGVRLEYQSTLPQQARLDSISRATAVSDLLLSARSGAAQ